MKKFLIATSVACLLSGCMVQSATNPRNGTSDSPQFLRDASATCGNPVMLMADSRDFEETTTVDKVNHIYDCVEGFLRASPEYRHMGSAGSPTNDTQYIERMRQIDLQRSVGAISAAQARAMAMEAYRQHGSI